jgi:hypothetical protein
MPKVPTYSNRTVEKAALPDVRVAQMPAIPQQQMLSSNASPAMFGADAARQMQVLGIEAIRGGEQIMGIAIQEQMALNTDAVLRAETAFKDEETQYRADLEARRGINAATAREDAAKWYDDQRRKHMEALENDAQRRAMTKIMADRRSSMMAFASAHQSREIMSAKVESLTASTNSSINSVASAGGDPMVMQQERKRITENLDEMSRMAGWTAEVRKSKELGVMTDLHSKVLNTLIDDDPKAAKSYLERYAGLGEIDEPTRQKFENYVKKANLEDDAEKLSKLTVSAGFNNGLAKLKSEREKVAQSNDKDRAYKLDVIDKATAMHKREFAEREQIMNYNQRQAAEQAWTMVRQGKEPPMSLRNAMDPHAAMTLERHIATAGEEKVKTDWGAYSLLRQVAKDKPEDFAKLDLYKYFGKLADKERETLLDLQGSIAKGSKEKVEHIQSLETFITNYAADNKLYASGTTKEDYYAFENTVKDNLQRMAAEKGKPVTALTDADRKAAADQAVMNTNVKDAGWFGRDKEMPRYKARELMAKSISDIPEKERARIRQAYKAKTGAMLADRKLVDLYNEEKGIK